MNLITVDKFRSELRGNRKPTDGVFRVVTDDAAPIDGADRTLRFCFSDGSIDRMGDDIDPKGWDVSDFNRNPVALWAHDSFSPPIGRASNVGPEGERLMGDIEFTTPEVYEFGDLIFRLLKGKFLRAVSVGFIPLEYSFIEDKDRPWGIHFERQTLLEISVCPVPANPNALGEARAKGIDTRPLIEWAEKALDGGGKIIIPKSELEALRKAAKEPHMTRRTPSSRRSADDEDDDKKKKCGRAADEDCGMDDPAECSTHARAKADDDDEEKLLRALRRLLKPSAKADDDDREDPPLEHHDAIRMAHKCLKTANAFMTESMGHYRKALDHISGVVDALNDDDGDRDPEDKSEEDPDADDDDKEKAARVRRAAERRRRLAAV